MFGPSALFLDSATPPVIQCFTSSGTFTCLPGTVRLEVITIGAGGGGGGGGSSVANSGNWGPGGAGGGGGAISCGIITSCIGATGSVVVGVGGAAGARSACYGADGQAGGQGGCSAFCGIIAGGGAGGGGGQVSCVGTLLKINPGGSGGVGTVCNGGDGGSSSACCNTNICTQGNPGGIGAAGGGGGGSGYSFAGCLPGGIYGAGNTIFGLTLGRGGSGRNTFPFNEYDSCPFGGGGGGGQSKGFQVFTNGMCATPGSDGLVKIVSHFV